MSSVLYCMGGIFLIFATFTLSNRTLTEKENVDALYFYSVLVGLISLSFLAYKQFKSNKKYFSSGIILSLVPVIIIFFKLGMIYFTNLNYYQAFNKVKWEKSNLKPFNMAKTLALKNQLVGLTRKEVISKLGYLKEIGRFDGETLVYPTEKYWYLMVDLNKSDTVIKVYLYEPGMD